MEQSAAGYCESRFQIPWCEPVVWTELHETLEYLIQRHDSALASAKDAARRTASLLIPLFPVMGDLCAVTCPHCTEPCCTVATLWYNFQDVVFLHLTGQKIPQAQPMAVYGEQCCYLGSAGCTLERIQRPWICTWYVCPPQTALLRRSGATVTAELASAVAEIKQQRRIMETAFLAAVAQ